METVLKEDVYRNDVYNDALFSSNNVLMMRVTLVPPPHKVSFDL